MNIIKRLQLHTAADCGCRSSAATVYIVTFSDIADTECGIGYTNTSYLVWVGQQ